MKYPQLVSTRAVNAISDWLVSRLEQLGVEAPQIYTRLLLSLLQSSVQINDPIEFSNLESFFASRKGGNKRYLTCDTDTLKKLNAVQCLRDIVSSEQEITTIENLVDELCVKLKDIEKQTAGSEDEDKLLVATLSLATASVPHHRCTLHHQHQHQHHSHHLHKQEQDQMQKNSDPTTAATDSADIETDPKKRYFRAFPALSKEMEDSFRVWRRNAKSLTWPVDRNNLSISTSSSSSTISSSFGSMGGRSAARGVSGGEVTCAKTAEKYIDEKDNLKMAHDKKGVIDIGATECLEISSNYHKMGTANAGVKRKTKRRRNQAMSKGKTNSSLRKNASGSTDVIECANTSGGGGVSRNGKNHRHSSPSYWDTDFEGCWEMGRDLIKEFIVRQNKNSRNRSTSESAAYNIRDATLATVSGDGDAANDKKVNATRSEQKIDEHEVDDAAAIDKASKLSSPLLPIVDISFCCDDDDTLASVSELTNDVCSLNAMGSVQRRLYERDAKALGSRELFPTDDSEDAMSNEQLDFEQFKAKFNSSVEALWKDAETEETTAEPVAATSSLNVFDLSTSNMDMPASLPVVASIKENLKNFWTNYYNHHFDVTKMSSHTSGKNNRTAQIEENCGNLSCGDSGSTHPIDGANTSDYFSMPHNLEVFDRSVGVRRVNDENGTPIALFLRNSIWSDNLNTAAGDTDESFYLKVRNSAKGLHQLDVVPNVAKNIINDGNCADGDEVDSAKANESGFNFLPYGISKWSEGINAGPNMQSQSQLQHQRQHQVCQQFGSNSTSSVKSNNCNLLTLSADCTDSSATASMSAVSNASNYTHHSGAIGTTTSTYNWQTPINTQNLQADLQSWSASNPMSLTEMYGSSTVRNMKETVRCTSGPFATAVTASENLCAPSITLLNHSPTSSGFVEYARIKSVVQIFKQDNVQQSQSANYTSQLRSKERYTEDENLLTSERTHFHPIKSYVDGYTFDICSALDVVQYKRSSSGYLYLEEEKYLEYTRSDNCVPEDDVGASATPLYASSNCEAATARLQRYSGKNKYEKDFVIKFRLQNSEIACQTEDVIESVEQQHPLNVIFSNAAKGVRLSATSQACSDAIEALNKAVAAAAKAAAAANLPPDNHWLPTADFGGSIGDVYQRHRKSLIWNMAQPAVTACTDSDANNERREDCCNEVDYCGINNTASERSLEQQWSMSEIRKKCQLAGHMNNNNNSGAQRAGEMQSLWGMCAACNSELKSVPANRLLRDELKLEADEIMSDLKYMQDLYIGRADGSDSDTGSESDWVADDAEPKDDEGNASQAALSDSEMNASSVSNEKLKQLKDANMGGDEEEEVFDNTCGPEMCEDSQTYAVIQKVNRLIAELLRPDNTFNQNDADNDNDIVNNNNSFEENKQFSGSLWHGNPNERNIWQLGISEGTERTDYGTLEPLKFLRQFNVDSRETDTKEDSFLSQLSWEHSNLAKIWQKTTPQEQQQEETLATMTPVTENIAPTMTTLPDSGEKITLTDEQTFEKKTLADKNFRNLRVSSGNFTELSAQQQANINNASASTNATATYKRVQQLLNNSNASGNAATKLKLANRKRRHSASQNYFHHVSASNNTLTNNNNDEIADLNNFNLKSNVADTITASCAEAMSNTYGDNVDFQNLLNAPLQFGGDKKGTNFNSVTCGGDILYNSCMDGNNGDTNDLNNQPEQTIITCKYHWTTIDAAEPMQGGEDADMLGCTTLSCLIDKNASILKHVTMVTRPLTR